MSLSQDSLGASDVEGSPPPTEGAGEKAGVVIVSLCWKLLP